MSCGGSCDTCVERDNVKIIVNSIRTCHDIINVDPCDLVTWRLPYECHFHGSDLSDIYFSTTQ